MGVLALLFLAVPQDPQPHAVTDDCPAACATCKTALAKALDHLVAAQREDGSWAVDKAGPAVAAYVTAFAGLALLHGDKDRCAKAAAKARDAVVAFVDNGAHDNGKRADRPARSTWVLSACAWFLAEALRAEKKDQTRAALDALVAHLSLNQGKSGGFWQGIARYDEGWTLSLGGNDSATALAVVALCRAKEAGAAVDAKSLERAGAFYKQAVRDDGSFGYSSGRPDDTRGKLAAVRAGRTLAASLAIDTLGLDDPELRKKVRGFCKDRLVDLGAFYCPNLWTALGGLACHAAGAEEWKAFRGAHLASMLPRQGTDGSLELLYDREKLVDKDGGHEDRLGTAYGTALFALVLQAPSIRLRAAAEK